MVIIDVLLWAALLVLSVLVARDARNVRHYEQERAAADALASRAADRLMIGDVDGAIRLARQSREHAERALDIMESW